MRVERLSGPDSSQGPLRSARASHTTLPSPSPQPRAQDEVKGAQRRARPLAARRSPRSRPARVTAPCARAASCSARASRGRCGSSRRAPARGRALPTAQTLCRARSRNLLLTRANSQVFPPSQPSVPEPSARDRPLAFLTTLGLEGTLPEKSRASGRLQTPGEKRQTVRKVQMQKVPPFPQHHHPALERQGRRERERGGESPVLEGHGNWDP